MKDILIIAHFISTKSEKGNGRFTYIADMLSELDDNSKVEIVTSSFCHLKKEQRNTHYEEKLETSYKLTMLHEPNYSKNVSLKRFYSHFMLGRNLRKYLKNRRKPDVIYCSVPSLDVAYVATRYAKKNNIKLIIDVQDLWPEAFKMVFNVPIISEIIFKPMELLANYVYKNADEVIAVSQTYVDRALEVNTKTNKGRSIFLGTDLDYFDRLKEENKVEKPNDEVWLSYIGTLGHSYNLTLVMDALKILKDKGINNIKFMVMGDGPLRNKFEEYAKELDVDVYFTGLLEYGEMVGYLCASDIAVNPIVKGAAGSIINKVGDYAAAGIPVLNTQECLEYRELIDEYNCGINCNNNDSQKLSSKIMDLHMSLEKRKMLGKNNRMLAEKMFDRKCTYKKILDVLN